MAEHSAAPLGGSDPASSAARSGESLGAVLVFLSALTWSVGGVLARIAEVENPWVTVFWRTGTASLFLLAFMVWRDGPRGTLKLFAQMGWPGLAVGICFATASTAFVVALDYTTVANILLMQAGVPLIAALISFVLFREPVRLPTWIAIAAVIGGVGVMVSDSLSGAVSPVGDSLSMLIAFAIAIATVVTRRYADIRMTPAVFTGSALGWLAAVCVMHNAVPTLAVTPGQLGILILFGASLGLGMAFFTTGARMIPSAFAALIGTAEPILGPVWVWLFLGETPSPRTVIGGGIILAALIAYLVWQLSDQHRPQRARAVPPVN